MTSHTEGPSPTTEGPKGQHELLPGGGLVEHLDRLCQQFEEWTRPIERDQTFAYWHLGELLDMALEADPDTSRNALFSRLCQQLPYSPRSLARFHQFFRRYDRDGLERLCHRGVGWSQMTLLLPLPEEKVEPLVKLIDKGELHSYRQLLAKIREMEAPEQSDRSTKPGSEGDEVDCPRLPSAYAAWRFPRSLKRTVYRIAADVGWESNPGSLVLVMVRFCAEILRYRPKKVSLEEFLQTCVRTISAS